MTLTRPRLVFVGMISLVALTGCSGGGGGGTSNDGSAAHAAAGSAPRLAAVDGENGVLHQAADGSAVILQQKAVIKNGDVSIRAADPQQARDRVDGLLKQLRGFIDAEQTLYDTDGQIHDSHLVLRVPVASFSRAMGDLEHLGRVMHSSSTGKDVTTQVIDVRQRLKTLRISLQDLNSFQRQAATIDQLLRFESAITQRRGEYQSLKAQRNQLVNETTMSTISLDISAPPPPPVATVHSRHAGFLTGLRHGWSALTGTVVVALTAVGAALPFAVLLALVGLPLWWWARRSGRVPPAPTPAEGPSD
jgi:hypothetical protein